MSDRHALTKARLRTVEAIARVALPPGGPADGAARVARDVNGWVLYMPRLLQIALPLGLLVFEWAALLFHGDRYSTLAPEPALRYLRGWLDLPIIPLREMARSLVKLALFSHYADPAVGRSIGYDPEPWMRAKIEERARLMALRNEDAP
jgi:hypothetical protein